MSRSRAYIAVLLSFALVFGMSAAAFGATQSELNEHRSAAEEARQAAESAQAEADRLAQEVRALDDKIAALAGKVTELEPQIAEASVRSERLRTEVESLRAQITQKEAEIKRTEADYEVQLDLLNSRLTSTYKNGSWFYIDMLLGSKDFDDLVARTSFVQRVISSNQDIAALLDATKTNLEKRRLELDRNLESVQVKRQEAEAVEANLKSMRAQRQAAVDEQESIQGEKASMMEESSENAERLRQLAEAEEAEAAKIEAELAARSSGGSGVYNGVMAWPVPGFYRVTSPYGPRICPYHGQEIHSGIDIGRNLDPPQPINGAAIVAAGDGEVIYAGYRGGYGNTVMIDHGNGLVTLYAHQQSGGIMVSVGDQVLKGQRIGTVGSTGNSTGPHLHFETRVNGVAIDPMKYVS